MTSRHLKIFISSTFLDMGKEREILLKKVFVKLKKEARLRAIEITEIDLRWGITEQEAENGKTVKICLDEIERCQDSPIFFLGILGSHYGWTKWLGDVDETILADKKYSWIEQNSNVSLTEIEIISALEKDTKHNQAFLYLKNEIPNEEMKLIKLKNRVKKLSKESELVHLDHYNTPNDFREKVERSLLDALDRLYPKVDTISELERVRASHQIFAKSREKNYIPHRANELKLN